MRDAALRTLSGAWWAPSLALAMLPGFAFTWGVDIRLRRARRLVDAGRRDEALRVYGAVQADITADLRRARRGCAR